MSESLYGTGAGLRFGDTSNNNWAWPWSTGVPWIIDSIQPIHMTCTPVVMTSEEIEQLYHTLRIKPADPVEEPGPRKCSCDMAQLMRAGCSCGGI